MTNGTLSKGALRFALIASLLTLLHTSTALAQTFGTGTFQGIIYSDSDNDEGFGFIRLTLMSSGTFSMQFNVGINSVGHHYYSMTGKFDSSGHWSKTGEAPTGYNTRYELPVNMDLQLDSIDNPTKISGQCNDYTHSSHIQLERIFVASRYNPCPQGGNYTFNFTATHSPDPPGTGWGRVIVTTTGLAIASGVTPDGHTFARSANITVYNNLPVFWVNAGTVYGVFSGWLGFQNQSSSDFTGQLTWIGPEEPGPNHAFVPYFVTTVNVTGSSYVYQRGMTALQLNSSTNNIHLTFTDGELDNQIDKDLTLNQYNRCIFSPPQRGYSMWVSPTTGLFGGTFLHPDGTVYAFRGAVLQKQNSGGGQFLTRDRSSGGVSFTAN